MTNTIDIVQQVLEDNEGIFFSVSELRRKIFYEAETSMNLQTIVKAIDVLKRRHFEIEESTERKGQKKIPTKIFRLITIKNNQDNVWT